jgi:hypothetical protein
MVGIDDLLVAAAEAAGKAVAADIAKDFVSAVLNFLATKDDIAAAVKQLEDYIGEQFDELRMDDFVTEVFSATAALQEYQNDPTDESYLDQSTDHLNQAQAWLENQLGHDGMDFLRLQFVEVVKYVTTDIAAWYSKALLGDWKNFQSSVARANNYLGNAINQIRNMEKVTVSDINQTVDYPMRDPGDPPGITWYHASFNWSSGAYGQQWFDGGPGRSAADALAKATTKRNAVLSQYQSDENFRQSTIYAPIQNFLKSINALKSAN